MISCINSYSALVGPRVFTEKVREKLERMKRFLSLLLIVAMLCSMAACGGETEQAVLFCPVRCLCSSGTVLPARGDRNCGADDAVLALDVLA